MTTKELKQLRYDIAYLKMATEWSQLSHAKRKQVGCLVVRENQIISDGYNGTPTGFDNDCEDENGDTHWYVLHSEANAILKCAKYGDSCDGATIYQTHSPCKECSKLIYQSGIKRLVYVEEYKDSSGIDFLINSGVKVKKVEIT